MFDGIDVRKIIAKDMELRDKINNQGQVMESNPSLTFDYDNMSGNIKVRDDDPLYVRNQR